jgi:hypothetical protein
MLREEGNTTCKESHTTGSDMLHEEIVVNSLLMGIEDQQIVNNDPIAILDSHPTPSIDTVNAHLPFSLNNEAAPHQRGIFPFKIVNSQELEEINQFSLGKRGRKFEVDNITSPMKRCRLINFNVGESLSAIDKMMLNNPRFNHFNLKCGDFEFTAKSI